jgi:integrase
MKSRRVDTGIVQRGNTYTFTVAMGMTAEGKQIRKTTTYIPPDGTAEKKADKLAKEEYVNFKNRCKGLSAFNENMRFLELSEEYFKFYAPNKLKPITAYNYEKMVAYHFKDYFGNKKLKEITSGMLTNFFSTHTTLSKERKDIPLSPSNAKKLYTILQSIFTFAVNQDYMKESPARNVILPSKKATTEEKRKYLTETELPNFLNLFQAYSVLNTIVKLLLFTGMRSGECLGLQWEDIDYINKTITIRHTLSDVGGKHFLTTPKSKSSRRYISMSDSIAELLREHKKHQLELRLAQVETFIHSEMVFTSDTGNYKDRSSLNTSFRNRIKGTAFDFLTLHSMRHCNATLLLNSGVDIKVVSDHLGHSDIGITANIYADVLASTRRKTAEIIELKLAK